MGNLVLSRKRGEEICIGSDIVITILGTLKGKVSVSIRAPDSLRVDRGEIRKKKLADVQEAWKEAWTPKPSVAIAAGSTSRKGT
jgi:carbon storage regulator CsrA|tara:strand:+ start:237 stop:488 length:252 start_codon:yes stop_codon:yes gene_type:complete